MEEFSLIRHGHKLQAGEERKPLEESGLTAAQQVKWKEAAGRLGDSADPEITYESLPEIEKMAEGIYEQLPEKATVLFATTDTPRTKMTSDLLSSELVRLTEEKGGKDIGVAFVWEPKDIASAENSMTRIAREAPGMIEKWKASQAKFAEQDEALKDYFAQSFGGRTHPKELEMFFELIKEDMAGENSLIKKRAEELKEQLENIEKKYSDENTPVYFYGVGHMSGLIALDVAFNHRETYSNVSEMPTPLSLWKANIKDQNE